MKIAIHGLGKMGMQIARKLAENGHEVIAHNRSPEPIKQATAYGATPATDKASVAAAWSGQPAIVWVMLPADIMSSQLQEWCDVLPAGSLLVDGGNSDYRQTKDHAQTIEARGLRLVDVGTSGGIMGYDQGFCMMVGGAPNDAAELQPVFASLAAPHGAYQYFGPHGAGHFVKMVHNAVEYGMMESLAEGYHVLRDGPYHNLDLAAVADTWQQGSIVTSTLNRLAADILKRDPELTNATGTVAESGEARWTIETAQASHIPTPAIDAALDVRRRSQQGRIDYATKLLAELRHGFGGHDINANNKSA